VPFDGRERKHDKSMMTMAAEAAAVCKNIRIFPGTGDSRDHSGPSKDHIDVGHAESHSVNIEK